jgi:hypothetical protein
MTVAHLLQHLQSLDPSKPFDAKGIRDRIHDLYEAATHDERGTLLAILNATMGLLERQTTDPEAQERLRAARTADYNLLLMKESLEGENVSPARLLAATAREVAAGRMSPDDEMHKLAQAGQLLLPPPPPSKKPGFLSRLFGAR